VKTKPFNIVIEPNFNYSFLIKHCKDPNLFVPLHYHYNYELMAILHGEGTRFIGDNIESFSAGDLVLVGKELPHVWLNHKEYYEGREDLYSEIIVLNFDDQQPGFEFLRLNEFRHIRKMLSLASQGILFYGKTQRVTFSLLRNMVLLKDADRFIALLRLLNFLSRSHEYRLICSSALRQRREEEDNERLSKVYQYINLHFNEDISEEKVAAHIGMNPSSFSRYFKARTYKNFSAFLNEVRISRAASMILENKLPVAEIAYLCGYKTLSNFNRQFKKIMHKTPVEYRQSYYNQIEK